MNELSAILTRRESAIASFHYDTFDTPMLARRVRRRRKVAAARVGLVAASIAVVIGGVAWVGFAATSHLPAVDPAPAPTLSASPSPTATASPPANPSPAPVDEHMRNPNLTWDEIQTLATLAVESGDEQWFDEPIPADLPAWILDFFNVDPGYAVQWGVHDGRDVYAIPNGPTQYIILERAGESWTWVSAPSATAVPADFESEFPGVLQEYEDAGIELDTTTVYYGFTAPRAVQIEAFLTIPEAFLTRSAKWWGPEFLGPNTDEYQVKEVFLPDSGTSQDLTMLGRAEGGLTVEAVTTWSNRLSGQALPSRIELGYRQLRVTSPVGWTDNAAHVDDISPSNGLVYYPFGAVNQCRWQWDSAAMVRGTQQGDWVPTEESYEGQTLFAATTSNPLIEAVASAALAGGGTWDYTSYTTPLDRDGVAVVDGEPVLLALRGTTDGEWYLWQSPTWFSIEGC